MQHDATRHPVVRVYDLSTVPAGGPHYPDCHIADWDAGSPGDVWETVDAGARRRDREEQTEVEPRVLSGSVADAGGLEGLVLQAGIRECGTPSLLFQGWDEELGC